MFLIYITSEWSENNSSYYHYEYRDEGTCVVKYKCLRNGVASVHKCKREKVDVWQKGDPDMPEWLKRYIEF